MWTRRSLVLAAGAMPVARSLAAQRPSTTSAPTAPPPPAAASTFPDKASFAPTDITYLDSGSYHPISRGARAAIESYLARRALEPVASQQPGVDDAAVLAKFARLVNVDPEEVTFVQSTTTGEQMVLRALGIPRSGGHIVTDTLHFFGSFPLYEELARQGMEVTWVRARDGRIQLQDIEAAVRRDTKLIALSKVSTFNGFEHDLKAVCDIAHARGAYVYADVIHAAGCIPLDLHASGVDFAACASYKWLMGDFGLGFLYARKDVQPKLQRTNYGYYALDNFKTHVYPMDPPGDSVADYTFKDNATGAFALGTHGEVVLAQLDYSLDYILNTGVERIQAHARTLTSRLKTELPQRGYTLLTPPESATPLVAFLLPDARNKLSARLKEEKIRMTLNHNHCRVSISVFNSSDDIDHLLSLLGRRPI